MNLTHTYGCDPLSALARVHPGPAQSHTPSPSSGSDLMYFANERRHLPRAEWIHRTGLTSGLCSGTNQFDDLNQNLGSMTQFVSFSQHTTDPNILLGGSQDNGSNSHRDSLIPVRVGGNVLSSDGRLQRHRPSHLPTGSPRIRTRDRAAR